MQWISTNAGIPEQGDRVVVYNGHQCWSTDWRHALISELCKAPVLYWIPEDEMQYPVPRTRGMVPANQLFEIETKISHAHKRRRTRPDPDA